MHLYQNQERKKMEILAKISELYQVSRCSQNTLILYTLKVLLGKNGSISFFSSSGKNQSYQLLGCHTITINSSLMFFYNSLLIYFLSSLRFSNLICQAKSLIKFL